MHGLMLLLTFIALIAITLNENSWIKQELDIHRILTCLPFLDRDFIIDTYRTFEPLCV